MKRKRINGASKTYYIRNELIAKIDKIVELSDDMNASDVVNMVLENAHLDDLIAAFQDGNGS